MKVPPLKDIVNPPEVSLKNPVCKGPDARRAAQEVVEETRFCTNYGRPVTHYERTSYYDPETGEAVKERRVKCSSWLFCGYDTSLDFEEIGILG